MMELAAEIFSERKSISANDLHILLAYRSHLTKALAAALLQITGDGESESQQHNNPAISMLRRLYLQPSLG
jgi:hypothetical protein